MERVCYVFEIKPSAQAEYKRRHDEIWPEALELLHQAGISDFSIFSRGTMLYAVLKAEPDWKTALRVLESSEVMHRWRDYMGDLIEWQLDKNGEFQYADEIFRFN